MESLVGKREKQLVQQKYFKQKQGGSHFLQGIEDSNIRRNCKFPLCF